MELKKDEIAVINSMRRHSGYVDFTIEKRPSKDSPDGELVRVIIEKSEYFNKEWRNK